MTLPRTVVPPARARFARLPRLGLVTALASVAMASAQPVPVGEVFDVNQLAAGNQAAPAVRMSNSGAATFAWHSDGQDGSDKAVVLRKVAPDGAPFNEFVANQVTAGDQDFPNLAMNASGDFTVTWRNGPTTLRAIAARSTVLSGSTLTAEFQANVVLGNILKSAVCRLDNDSNVVVWPNGFLRFRRYSADGDPLSAEEGLNDVPSPQDVGVACLSDGRFVIIWGAGDSDGAGVFAVLIDGDGEPVGEPIQVNEDPVNDQVQAVVASDGATRFVVAWLEQASPESRLEMRRYFVGPAAAASPPTAFAGDEIALEIPLVNMNIGNVDMASDGAFVLSYEQSVGASNVRALEFSRTGAQLPGGPAIPVAPGPFTASIDAGVGLREYLLVWEQDDDLSDIRARRYLRRAVYSDDFETAELDGWSAVVD